MRKIRLYSEDDLLSRGVSGRRRTALIQTKKLVRVRPGVFVEGPAWRDASPEERLVALAQALDRISVTRPTFSHETAAAAHGLPLYRASVGLVHAIVSIDRPGAASHVVRHRGEIGEEDIVEVSGVRCTNLERTVADVARTMTFEQSVTVADAALRLRCVPRAGEYLEDRAAEFRDFVSATAERSAHGVTRARRALEFADGRAQLPGESISRILLRELGFSKLDLQVRVAAPEGKNYFVDFGFDAERAFGEFDGAMKYVDGRLTDGRSTAEIMDREKQREDWIRGTTHRRLARWGWAHLKDAKSLATRLAEFGIVPSR